MGVVVDEKEPFSTHSPILLSYNDRIRPLLDCIDKLRNLKIMQEGIQLPTIVVVGDQSSGKSSVLESLARISLPRGQGICTRVPLIMKLQNSPVSHPELSLEFNGRVVSADEGHVAEAISIATDEIAGRSKGISNSPLTLIVKKNDVPDLTMIDLPGITRVPVHGQPEDIYEQISGMISDYITPQESIILNVLSADVDFTTCESIRMSRKVDRTGERTLAVVTKVDKSPEGLLEKVIADDVNIGLGYVCVRNRIGNESYEDARAEESALFEEHPLLSKISKSMVGIQVLAQKLVLIQASLVSKSLPDIVRKIDDKFAANVADLDRLPRNLASIAEAMATFMRILSSGKESLRKIVIRGEFDEFPEEKEMHCTARLAEMLDRYSDKLQNFVIIITSTSPEKNFLQEEMDILEEAKGIELPNFLPRTAFLAYLQKMVKAISATPVEFVDEVWNYLESALIPVFIKHFESYPQIQSSVRRAAHDLIAKKKRQSVDWVMQILEMEKFNDYTCDPEYMSTWRNLMAKEGEFIGILTDHSKPGSISIDGFGNIEVGHLRNRLVLAQQAFDLKMRMMAYWNIVLKRLVDCMALHVQFSIQNLVNKDIEVEIVNGLMMAGGRNGVERMMGECPVVAEKRYRLKSSISVLQEAKEILASVMDRAPAYGD